MNKKTVILALSGLGILFLIIGISVFYLYSGSEDTSQMEVGIARQYRLVEAVPSDAAAVFFSDNFKDMVEELNDSTTVLKNVFTEPDKPSFSHFMEEAYRLKEEGRLKSLANKQTIISLHYGGNLVPLLIVDAGSNVLPDESVTDLEEVARKTGLYTSYLVGNEIMPSKSALSKSSVLLVSSSETLLLSSKRHLESGNSILDADGFASVVSSLGGEDAIVISNHQANKFLKAYAARKWMRASDLFRNFSIWTVLVPEDFSGKSFKMVGKTFSGNSIAYYANVLKRTPAGESHVVGILPRQTSSVISLAFDDSRIYLEQFRNFLDAQENLSNYKVENQRLKSETGIDVAKWIELLDIKEVAKVSMKTGDKISQILLTRIKKENEDILLKGLDCHMKQLRSSVLPYAYGNYIAAAFGKVFSLEEETHFMMKDNWIVSGSSSAVEDFMKLSQREGSLLEDLVKGGVCEKSDLEHMHLFSYASFIEDREAIRNNFNVEMQQAINRSLNGIAAFPIVFDITGREEEDLQLHYRSARLEKPLMPEAEPVVLDTVIHIDQGPYSVKNFSTGKRNLLVQNANLSITLKNEDGKGMWSIPFSRPICGRVETIDYYGNGKLQFLFGAGNSLYLLDRLGRYVKPFPVELEKEIQLGPAAYDFTGAHGYKAMILFKDNTIDMLNLHGKKPADWKGIANKDKILKLPELLEVGEHKYWVVRTVRQTLVYPFYGGEPVFLREGMKMLRPDTEIVVKGNNSISFICHDGKKHTVKLK